ncbi:MAG: PHP domain-containing protein [Alphaproteobacteria bacterium]|nr:PHP domain-containing protein [Alphaproteobacteria bacterium]MBQ8677877.1 PHP domain-containing protein [Alphaproteobacteria bacterium]
MQNFSYHMHTNNLGIFDGQNTPIEMIKRSEEIGFKKIGISNHLAFHPNMPSQSKMFFSDFNKACDIYKSVIEDIRTASLKAKIDVRVGFEVDFFSSYQWRSLFEKIKKEIKADYYIGATHYLRDESENYIMNLYYMKRNPQIKISEKDLTVYLNIYWDNIIESIKSGYFNFIAHLDVCKLFGFCLDKKWDEKKYEVIETLEKYKQPYELNTSGWTKVGEQHPHTWMIEELNKRNVPVIVSDDAHSVIMLAQHFEQAESFLSKMNYKCRYCPEF